MTTIESQIGLADPKVEARKVRYERYSAGRELAKFFGYFGWFISIGVFLVAAYAFSLEENLTAALYLGAGLFIGFMSSLQSAVLSAFFDVAENIEVMREAVAKQDHSESGDLSPPVVPR